MFIYKFNNFTTEFAVVVAFYVAWREISNDWTAHKYKRTLYSNILNRDKTFKETTLQQAYEDLLANDDTQVLIKTI